MELPKIALEMDGLDEIKQLVEQAQTQASELMRTVDQINMCKVTLQAKINQPTAGTDG